MQSYCLKVTFKAPKKRKCDFQKMTVSSSFKGGKEMPVEGNCVSYPLSLVSDILLGMEKNKSKDLGKPLQEGLISVC